MKEITMRSGLRREAILLAMAGLAMLLMDDAAYGQSSTESTAAPAAALGNGAGASANNEQVNALSELVRQLQAQVQSLNARVKTLEAKERNEVAGSQISRAELKQTSATQITADEGKDGAAEYSSSAAPSDRATASSSVVSGAAQQDADDRLGRVEEDVQLANSKIQEQSQTKVESSSKYRVRLSGLALFNLFENRGTVDSVDVPQIATPPGALSSVGTFGGTLRQSQIGLEAFGPDVAGAHTSAEIRFDFAGGFPQAPNGNNMGLVRLRTGEVRLDWGNTSIVAGQDYLFFSPLAPTSFASVAIPALSYSGNLWGWTPQVRVEHRFHVSEESAILVQGGILQPLSDEYVNNGYLRTPTPGEQAGQPAYAARLAWSRSAFGENVVAGIGGYYARQNWGFGRIVDSWVATADLTVPLGQFLEFSGQFYRGQAVGGLGGGVGQSVLWNAPLNSPATEVYGLDSMGGWVQLKIKPARKFEINGALGDDNPFSSELRPFENSPNYANGLLSRNFTPFVNFIYRPRSDLIFSLEYKHLKTFTVDSNANAANHINLSVGYIF
jgi:hypothetical protein